MGLAVRNITIDLGSKPAKRVLDQVSFDVEEGKFLSLLGASGAGKSTILKIVSGTLIQDEGAVEVDGVSIDSLPPHRREIGYVFQDMRLFPHMNVEENVAFPARMHKVPKRERMQRAHELLACVQLEGFEKREVASLSGGQQQRVALARALAGNPRMLLLDEPFSGLDESLRDEMRALVLKLHREFKITTIMVTHDALEALEMSDRIAYISAGKILQEGSPRNLYTSPATQEVAACFGDCSIIEGSVDAGLFVAGSMHLAAPGCPVGAACVVIRSKGAALGSAPGECVIKSCVYRGDSYLVRLEVARQELTVQTSRPYDVGALVSVEVSSDSFFVYAQERPHE